MTKDTEKEPSGHAVHSAKYLNKDDFAFNDFLSRCCHVVGKSYPFQLIFCFCFFDQLVCFCQVGSKGIKTFLRLFADAVKIFISFARRQLFVIPRDMSHFEPSTIERNPNPLPTGFEFGFLLFGAGSRT